MTREARSERGASVEWLSNRQRENALRVLNFHYADLVQHVDDCDACREAHLDDVVERAVRGMMPRPKKSGPERPLQPGEYDAALEAACEIGRAWATKIGQAFTSLAGVMSNGPKSMGAPTPYVSKVRPYT